MDFGGKCFPMYIPRKSIREHKQGLGRSLLAVVLDPLGPMLWQAGHTGDQAWGMDIKADGQDL